MRRLTDLAQRLSDTLSGTCRPLSATLTLIILERCQQIHTNPP